MNRRIIERMPIDETSLDTKNWKSVIVDDFSEKDKDIFSRRKQAIEMYIERSKTVKEISKITRIEESEIRRLFKRCISENSEGEIWGFCALIPSKHLKDYCKKIDITTFNESNTKGMAGAFTLLLKTYPILKEKIEKWLFNKSKGELIDPVISIIYLHKRFIEECRSLGIKPPNEYPFNTKTLGFISLHRYVKKLNEQHIVSAAKRVNEDAARRARTTGKGNKNYIMTLRPFQKVEFDGHLIDGEFILTYTNLEGDEVTDLVGRIWLLLIIDVATRVILGYYISPNSQYSSEDVLHCLQNAFVPKKLKDFVIPELKYPENSGFYSIAIPEIQGAVWEEFYYDNSKANLSNIVKKKLKEVYHCSINAGPVNMPERRNIVENVFHILEENGFHRLPNTTGSKPTDPRRKNPEKNALKYNISLEILEEITEIVIANYNNTPNEAISYLTPIECMQQRIKREYFPRILPAKQYNNYSFLSLQHECTVRGKVEDGRRPHIHYEGVEYRSDVLSLSSYLLGKKLKVSVNMDDLRVIKAFLPDGSEFGMLTATGKWGVIPHNLQTRKLINRLKRLKLIHFTSMDDPILALQKYLYENRKKQNNKKLYQLKQNYNKLEKEQELSKVKNNVVSINNKKSKEESEEIPNQFIKTINC